MIPIYITLQETITYQLASLETQIIPTDGWDIC